MPADPTGEAIYAMGAASPNAGPRELERIYRALHSHLTAPAGAEVDVWHISYAAKLGGQWHPECAARNSEAAAAEYVLELGRRQDLYAFATVTGPHKQTVPA